MLPLTGKNIRDKNLSPVHDLQKTRLIHLPACPRIVNGIAVPIHQTRYGKTGLISDLNQLIHAFRRNQFSLPGKYLFTYLQRLNTMLHLIADDSYHII